MQHTGYILFNKKTRQKKNHPINSQPKKLKRVVERVDGPVINPNEKLEIVSSDIIEKNNEQRLQILADSQEQFEFRIRAFWIFELIPNEVVVDIHKVSFIDKTFLFKNVTSIFIKDIAKIEVTNDLFFATLEIINMTQTIELQIKHLKKDDARIAQAIIQGLMAVYKNEIDLTALDPSEITDELQKLGTPVK